MQRRHAPRIRGRSTTARRKNHGASRVTARRYLEHLADSGLATTGVDDTICCYAEKTETWVEAPDGNRWEWYVKHGDTEQLANTVVSSSTDSSAGCCG